MNETILNLKQATRQSDFDQFQQVIRGEDVTNKSKLFTLVVATTTVSTTNPADASLSNLLMGFIVKAYPLKMRELSPELNNRPTHRDTWLGNDGPPVLLTLLLFRDAMIRTILTVINKIGTIFLRQKIAAALTQCFAVCRPELAIFSFDLLKCVVRPYGGELSLLEVTNLSRALN